MIVVLFYALIVLAAVISVTAILMNYRWFWLAGLLMYIASFIAGFSIGYYLLVFTFVFWTLAVAHTFRWVKKPWYASLFVSFGALLWKFSVFAAAEWLFYPLWVLWA